MPTTAEVDLSLLTEEAEINLIKKMGELPEEILLAATLREPHRIALCSRLSRYLPLVLYSLPCPWRRGSLA